MRFMKGNQISQVSVDRVQAVDNGGGGSVSEERSEFFRRSAHWRRGARLGSHQDLTFSFEFAVRTSTAPVRGPAGGQADCLLRRRFTAPRAAGFSDLIGCSSFCGTRRSCCPNAAQDEIHLAPQRRVGDSGLSGVLTNSANDQ